MMIKQYLHDLMHDKRNGFLSRPVKLLLLIISYAYGFFVRWNHFFYNVNLLKSYKAAVTVISVGNITLGGTGKTPFVIMLAGRLAQNGKKIAVLIRGYGEDEWKLLEDKLKTIGAKVFVARDRVKAARQASESGARTVILDDGFQHRRLKRDLDIVLLDSGNPFGNRRLFPRGILREPPLNLKRADIIVLTKADWKEADARATERKVRKILPGTPLIKAFHKPVELVELWKGGKEALSAIDKKRICIFSAICDSGYFRRTVEKTGAVVELEFIFPDHYLYKTMDLARISRKCKARNVDTVIVTEKDAVKLKGLIPRAHPGIFALSIELEIIEGEEKLDAELHRLYMRACRKNS